MKRENKRIMYKENTVHMYMYVTVTLRKKREKGL